MGISPRLPHVLQGYIGFALCILAAARAFGDPPAETPTGSFLSSLKQAINKDFDHEVVRGHFDVGTPPDSHRYYCLVDPKTGKGETNGVAGQPFLRPDGMTGVKGGAVSFYSCANAEQRGTLVTGGYVLSAAAAAARASAPPPSPPRQSGDMPASEIPPPDKSAPADTTAPSANGASDDSIEVAGVRLGMSPEQVRAVLKSRKLLDYFESSRNLSDDPAIAMQAGGRFVNSIAAWTWAPADASAADGEAYEVMFTPVPGRERAMAIVHSISYSIENSVKETTLQSGLVKKYGGYSGPDLPDSPTWRIQRGGIVLAGDSCSRRAVVGGLRELDVGARPRQNLALKTAPEEFQYQVDHCGVAMVTEDHITANGGASRQDRTVTRFTVAAYSPSIGLDGATAAMQLVQTARNALEKSKAPHIKDRPAPNL